MKKSAIYQGKKLTKYLINKSDHIEVYKLIGKDRYARTIFDYSPYMKLWMFDTHSAWGTMPIDAKNLLEYYEKEHFDTAILKLKGETVAKIEK
jgi:hypothetical protein